MKEDILEQMVEDWFIPKPGRFIKHNIKYRPEKINENSKDKNKYAVHSDIDLLGIDLNHSKDSTDRVFVFNCKSWQGGLDFKKLSKKVAKGLELSKPNIYGVDVDGWKKYKEFIDLNWCNALIDTVEEQTNQRNFTYMFAVTKGSHDDEMMKNNEKLTSNFKLSKANFEIKVITIKDLYNDFIKRILEKKTKSTPEVTNLGRMIQLFFAAGILCTNK